MSGPTLDVEVFQRLLALSVPDNALAPGPGAYDMYEAEGYRWICFPPGAVQCALNLAEPSQLVLPNQRAMLLASLVPNAVDNALDLGTGGGGFVRALSVMGPPPRLRCVEVDPSMVALAREYFQLPAAQPVNVLDAVEFLTSDDEVYDLVLCDVFRGLESPPLLAGSELLELLVPRLADDGVAAINTLPRDEAQVRKLLIEAKARFPGVALLGMQTLGNIVFFLSKQPLPRADEWRAMLDASPLRADAVLESALIRLVYA